MGRWDASGAGVVRPKSRVRNFRESKITDTVFVYYGHEPRVLRFVKIARIDAENRPKDAIIYNCRRE